MYAILGVNYVEQQSTFATTHTCLPTFFDLAIYHRNPIRQYLRTRILQKTSIYNSGHGTLFVRLLLTCGEPR